MDRAVQVSVIIVNWNAGVWLRRCLDALSGASASSEKGNTHPAHVAYEVLVVDNASRDDSVAQAQGSAQPFRVVPMGRNAGFAAAVNRGASESSGEILLVLNPDTELQPGSLAEIVAAFARHPRGGIIGPRLLNSDGTHQPSCRRFPTAGVLLLTLARLARLLHNLPAVRRYEMADLDAEREQRVEQVMGAALAIRRETFQQLGGFDEGYWIWFEEVDFCRRAVAAGWETWYVPGATVVHERATAFAQVSPLTRAWWFARSAVRYARKQFGWGATASLALLVPVAVITALPATLFRVPPRVAPRGGPRISDMRSAAHVRHEKTLVALGVAAVALFLGLFFSAQAGLLLLAAAWLAVATWRFPWPAFLLLLAVAPFLLIVKATVVFGPLTVLKDIVILALFLRVLREAGAPARAVGIPTLFLVGWSVVAFLRADAVALGLLRLRDLLLYVPLLLVAHRLVRSPERLRRVLAVFLAVLALVLALGAVQLAVFPDGAVLREVRVSPERSVWLPRLSSALAHPNILGGYLLFGVPLAAAVAVRRVPRLWVPAVFLTLAGLAATYAAYSRSAWIALAGALAAGVVVAVFLWRPRLAGGALALTLAVAVASFAIPSVQHLTRSVIDPTYASNRERLEFLSGVVSRLSNVGAVGGEGLGDTVTLLGRDVPISLYEIAAAGARHVQVAKARTFLDNAVAKTWIEQGVIGLVLAGWVAARVLVQSLGVARAGPAEGRAVGLGFAATLVGLALLWLFLDVPDMFPVNLYFWTFAGLVSGASTYGSPSHALPFLGSARGSGAREIRDSLAG